jgi:glutamyl-Q tRNA(Asp) synthetase
MVSAKKRVTKSACNAWKLGQSQHSASKLKSVGNSPNANIQTATTSIAELNTRYRGRFAPSPTGPLHFGSLVAATASYLQALVADGEWLLRIEDIDPPREIAGAADHIIASLRAHGFRWDGEIYYQRDNLARFDAVVDALLADQLAFPCSCSRAQILDFGAAGLVGPIYPGTCRDKRRPEVDEPYAIRLRVPEKQLSFDDRLLGRIECSMASDIGDFIIRRKDGLIAYVLAVVLDDHAQRVTEIVRGVDLLNFTPAQVYLQQLLDLNTPDYMHVPVAVNPSGFKLSKQTGALAINDATPAENLVRCLEFLEQDPPASLATASVPDVWTWAKAHWQPQRLAGHTSQC